MSYFEDGEALSLGEARGIDALELTENEWLEEKERLAERLARRRPIGFAPQPEGDECPVKETAEPAPAKARRRSSTVSAGSPPNVKKTTGRRKSTGSGR